MAELVKLVEGTPPPLWRPVGLSPAAELVPEYMVWSRIERYTGRRFGERTAEWHVRGGGYWSPAVEPWQIDTISLWNDATEAWTDRDVPWHPTRGYNLEIDGDWRFVGTVGRGSGGPGPMEPFEEAYLRLAEYLAAGDAAGDHWAPGIRSYTVSDTGVSITQQRAANWKADAFRQSGAADVLRYHRRPR